jgi:hypothetical protein
MVKAYSEVSIELLLDTSNEYSQIFFNNLVLFLMFSAIFCSLSYFSTA